MVRAAGGILAGALTVPPISLDPIEGYQALSGLAVGRPATPPRVDVAESDDALILYTSGTTGRPERWLLDHHHTVWVARRGPSAATHATASNQALTANSRAGHAGRGDEVKIEVISNPADPGRRDHSSGALLPGPDATRRRPAGRAFAVWLDLRYS